MGACGTLQVSAPVDGTVTSDYGPRGGRNHDGLDIAAPTGTPVRAAECGVVSSRGVQGGYGNMVCVKHSSRFETCYAHLSRYAVSAGQEVRKGQVIGHVGCTGSCTGPHVHFETRVDGQAKDPSPYLRGALVPGEPTVEPKPAPVTAKASSQGQARTTSVSRPAAAAPVSPHRRSRPRRSPLPRLCSRLRCSPLRPRHRSPLRPSPWRLSRRPYSRRPYSRPRRPLSRPRSSPLPRRSRPRRPLRRRPRPRSRPAPVPAEPAATPAPQPQVDAEAEVESEPAAVPAEAAAGPAEAEVTAETEPAEAELQ